ncbi:MAG: TIGR01440 family protein [Lachnospiraceae bacterium]|nr:TIGR01440 family protein [Lachnospiraceae bacterium]
MSLEEIRRQAGLAMEELVTAAKLTSGDIVVVGCSSSEVVGERIGTSSSVETAEAIFAGLYPVLEKNGLYLAAQCCEHLNRAIIIEKECARRERIPLVNAVPQPKAGGSFATTAYKNFREPAAVEHVRAQAGLDIGGTLIGMHMAEVAVPVRLSVKRIGEANILCARVRPKFIGGERAHYDPELK